MARAFLGFLIITLARIQEVGPIRGLRLYFLAVIVLMPVLFLSGRWSSAWESVPGKALLGLTGWMCIGLPFSEWKGGTFSVLTDDWVIVLLTFMFCATMVADLKHMRQAMYVAGLSAVVNVLMYAKYGIIIRGRGMLPSGTFANSNDFALHLIVVLPFVLFIVADQKGFSLVRLIAAATIAPLLYVVVQTGSRSALVAVAALVLVYFFMTSFMSKVKLVALTVAGGIALLTLAPESVLRRYSTLWNDGDQEVSSEAVASAESRKLLLIESLRQTALNPVFGVGAGNFPVVHANKMKSMGIYYHVYVVSHNSYTQISSEAGIPGFLFYCAILFWSLRMNLKLYKAQLARRQPQIAGMALCLFFALVAFAVNSFFGSNAYRFYLPLAAGLTVSLKRVIEEAPGINRVPA